LGAGQFYADDADSQDFRFYKSKGVNVWTKGQLSLLNDTKVGYTQADPTKNVRCVATQNAVFVTDGSTVKYSTDPFASSPTWNTVSGLPALTPRDIATDGSNVYLTYAGATNAHGLWKINTSYVASNVAYGHEFGEIGYAKGRLILGAAYLPSVPYGDDIYYDPAGNVTGDSDEVKISPWEWIGFAGGQGAIYAAGHSGSKSVIFKITITSAGVLDKLVSALELPNGEIVSAIHGYLGFILVGTNKGVRFCTADGNNNLTAGPLIPTSGSVYGFTADDRFVWFTWSNYDGVSGGLGRLDLSRFTAVNAPAYATDLMYASTGDVLSVASFNGKRLFSVSGVGLVVEDTSTLVSNGTLETGYYTWDIPDKKFVPRFDIRTSPLKGSVELFTSYDRDTYISASTFSTSEATDYTYPTDQSNLIEASYKLSLNRSATVTQGPTVTRWMARGWASPTRSKIVTLPILLHQHMNVQGQDFYLDVEQERELLEQLVSNPGIVTYQERNNLYSVIVEDIDWKPLDSSYPQFLWEGTAVVTMRTVAE